MRHFWTSVASVSVLAITLAAPAHAQKTLTIGMTCCLIASVLITPVLAKSTAPSGSQGA